MDRTSRPGGRSTDGNGTAAGGRAATRTSAKSKPSAPKSTTVKAAASKAAPSKPSTQKPTRAPPQAGGPDEATLTDAKIPSSVLENLSKVRLKILRAQAAISRGRAAPNETEARRRLHDERERSHEELASISARARAAAGIAQFNERIIGSDDILHIDFLARGMLAARSVARLVYAGGLIYGTGFLCAPNALITNNHVIPTPEAAHKTVAEFEMFDAAGVRLEIRHCELAPERFWFTSEALDITVVAFGDTPEARACTAGLGWHPMVGMQGKIVIGESINIIQHPGGRGKSVVLHNSNLLHLENDSELAPFMWYSSDTERGSSGAPVFNNRWEVVGVHHRSVPRADELGRLLDEKGALIPRAAFETDPDTAVWVANQGVRTSRIVAALKAELDKPMKASWRIFLEALLERWEGSQLRNEGQAEALRAANDDRARESLRNANLVRTGGGITLRISIDPV